MFAFEEQTLCVVAVLSLFFNVAVLFYKNKCFIRARKGDNLLNTKSKKGGEY